MALPDSSIPLQGLFLRGRVLGVEIKPTADNTKVYRNISVLPEGSLQAMILSIDDSISTEAVQKLVNSVSCFLVKFVTGNKNGRPFSFHSIMSVA